MANACAYRAPLQQRLSAGFLAGRLKRKADCAPPIRRGALLDLVRGAQFFIGLPLTFCLLLVARPLWRDPIAKRALLLGLAAYIGPALDTRVWPHYAAAETVVVYMIAACGLRAFRNAWSGVDGAYLMWGALAVFVLPTVLGLMTPANRYLPGSAKYLTDAKHVTIDQRLEKLPGEHLVLVRYGPAHQIYEELVYNHADIDGSKTIWARSLGAEKDTELIRHYPNRDVWTVYEDGGVTLSPLPFAVPSYSSRLQPTMSK